MTENAREAGSAKAIRPTYSVVAERDGDYWLLRIPSVGWVTQAKRLDQAEAMARDLIGIMTDAPSDTFDVVVTPRVPAGWEQRVERARRARDLAALYQARSTSESITVARELSRRGYPVRDIGFILGVTHQRVSQWLASATVDEPVHAGRAWLRRDTSIPRELLEHLADDMLEADPEAVLDAWHRVSGSVEHLTGEVDMGLAAGAASDVEPGGVDRAALRT